jgi:N-acetyl-D-muramate 6-phosphate phosphatase
MRAVDPLPPLLGVVFDLDGTLILSHHDFRRMQESIVLTAEEAGVAVGRVSVRDSMGTSETMHTARQELVATHPTASALVRFDTDVQRRIDSIEMEAVPRTTARSGALALLRTLRRRELRLGLFTRSSDPFCRATLPLLGLDEFFPHVRTRSAPGPAKPAPEALFLLLREMCVPPARTLFIGDHLEDARCATQAGVLFYGVLPDPQQPNPTTAEQFLSAGAAEVVDTLDEIQRWFEDAAPSGHAGGR